MRCDKLELRFTHDLRLEAINFYFFENSYSNFDMFLDYFYSFLYELKNEQLFFRRRFPRAIYIKVYLKVKVICPLSEYERDYYFSSTSHLIQNTSDFNVVKESMYSEIYNQIKKLEESIYVESGCEVEEVVLKHVNITEWVSRKFLEIEFGIPSILIEAYESNKCIGFRNRETKRFIFMVRKKLAEIWIRKR